MRGGGCHKEWIGGQEVEKESWLSEGLGMKAQWDWRWWLEDHTRWRGLGIGFVFNPGKSQVYLQAVQKEQGKRGIWKHRREEGTESLFQRRQEGRWDGGHNCRNWPETRQKGISASQDWKEQNELLISVTWRQEVEGYSAWPLQFPCETNKVISRGELERRRGLSEHLRRVKDSLCGFCEDRGKVWPKKDERFCLGPTCSLCSFLQSCSAVLSLLVQMENRTPRSVSSFLMYVLRYMLMMEHEAFKSAHLKRIL